MKERKPRKSLSQMAAEAGGNIDGDGQIRFKCPRCGCEDLRTMRTGENAAGNVVRTRYCRLCGRDGPRIYTHESPYRVSDP